ncbi:unnamed protein product [Staurois parvus]|uniref:Uncharacterized protein n=1 Tax=Staurois parvus TaxID=386267 RepID=A0ABN9GQ47_9NEOB|nr:unnamed protein product [Staurois parvus]
MCWKTNPWRPHLTTYRTQPLPLYIKTAGQWQSRGGLPFINSTRHYGLCTLPGSARTSPSYGTSVRDPDHVITDWPISDHMQSSKQDVTYDIIAYYV